eukprot:2485467-Heterocapsa_arctica.AAC.1
MRAGKKTGQQLADFMDDFKGESGDTDRPCHLLLESPHLKKFVQILQAAVDDHYTGVFPGYN